MNVKCDYCDALVFQNEHGRIKHNCCHHGKIQLVSPQYPEALRELLLGHSSDTQHFRQNIRSYNAFAMAAFAPAEEILFNGISCATVKGEVNALAATGVIPKNVEKPRYAQIYIHENDATYTDRLSDKCSLPVLQIIQSVMSPNPYVKNYKTLYQKYEEHPEEDVHLMFRRSAISDGRRYNLPASSASSEIAAVIVTGNDGIIPSAIDFVVYPKQNYECQKLFKLSQHVEPMVFPLLFPLGNPDYYVDMKNNLSARRIKAVQYFGWQKLFKLSQHVEPMVFPLLLGNPDYYVDMKNNLSARRITAVQYFGWQLRVTNSFNIITMAGRLTQQYVIHGYITNEWNRLNYFRTHQDKFRRESVQGLQNQVERSAGNMSDAVRLGRIMVLPSTFEGSPRSMQQHFQDAMALSREVGRPDLFITFTSNPQWPELRDFLRTLPADYAASGIPHVAARAFLLGLILS
nr:uncharacterized protein LOC122272693 [Parasteatoda tepidariorum]